jgi:hypothetical protein
MARTRSASASFITNCVVRRSTSALENFVALWSGLTPERQARVLRQLIERVDYDGAAGKLAITLRSVGTSAIASELNAETTDDSSLED